MEYRCVFCGRKITRSWVCIDCFIVDVLRDHLGAIRDIKYERQSDGSLKKIHIMRGLPKNECWWLKEKHDEKGIYHEPYLIGEPVE